MSCTVGSHVTRLLPLTARSCLQLRLPSTREARRIGRPRAVHLGDSECDVRPQLRHEAHPPAELVEDEEGRHEQRLPQRVEQRRLAPLEDCVPWVQLRVPAEQVCECGDSPRGSVGRGLRRRLRAGGVLAISGELAVSARRGPCGGDSGLWFGSRERRPSFVRVPPHETARVEVERAVEEIDDSADERASEPQVEERVAEPSHLGRGDGISMTSRWHLDCISELW